MNKFRKICFIVLHFLILALGFVHIVEHFTVPDHVCSRNMDLIKTVAHADIDNPDYELIWSDDEADIAYYRYVGERDLIKAGDTVYLYNGEKCTVVSTGLNGFNIKSDDVIFMVGMSGDAIVDSDKEQIGYISSLCKDGTVYCIWS